jgi:hypothetical protein
MTRQECLSQAVLRSRDSLLRYLKGFDDSNHATQAPSLPNHVAWTLGHLAMTTHRAAERLDRQPLPDSDFFTLTPGGDSLGAPDRYDTESVAFGSRPVADPNLYPPYHRCLDIFEGAVNRMAAAVRDAPDDVLDRPSTWGRDTVPTWSLATRMVFHNGTHCGQIADLRRALGMGSILG